MNNDFQSRLDRIGHWRMFQINWSHIHQLAALRLCDLCALSVGVDPWFAELVQEMTSMSPSDDLPADITEIAAYRNPAVDEFERRMVVAVNHLAPFGTLAPASAEAIGCETPLRISDFVTWAAGIGWALPDELKCMGTNTGVPECSSVSDQDKPLSARERNTLTTLIASLCKDCGIDYKARGAAKQIADLTETTGTPVTDDTIRKVLATIPDALEARLKF